MQDRNPLIFYFSMDATGKQLPLRQWFGNLGLRLSNFFQGWHQFLFLGLLGGMILSAIGCQRPVGNQSNRQFMDPQNRPRLFASQSPFNRNDSNANQYAADFPDIRIDDGQGQGRLNERLGAFDNDNQLLNTEVAGLQQKLDLANQYNSQLKEQLAGTTNQVSQLFAERESAAQQVASLRMQLEQVNQNLMMAQQQVEASRSASAGQLASNRGAVPGQLAGGATLSANNSLLNKVSNIRLPGAQARMDGDVIRIEFPSDVTFVPGTYQIQPNQIPLLQNISGLIQREFPGHIIGVEAHWDGTPLQAAGITDHQLTATQALAVFNDLIRLGLPKKQLFTMAMGSNRPRHAELQENGISPNRRIEIVIYPETFDR